MTSSVIQFPRSPDISVEPGLLLRSGPNVFRIDAINGEIATLRHAVSLDDCRIIKLPTLLAQIGLGKIIPAEDDDLLRAINRDNFAEDDQQVLIKLPTADLSEAQIDHVLILMRYIRGLRQLDYQSLSPKNPTIQLDIKKLHRHFGDQSRPVPKAAWIYSWALKLDKAGGDPRALIPHYDKRGGKGNKKIAKEVRTAIKQVLDRKRDDPKAPIKTFDVLGDVRSVIQIEHPTQPELTFAANWSTVDRWIKEQFSAYELCRRNHGRAQADQRFRDWYPREKSEFPLAVWETDDTDSCIFTVDERSGLPAGRAHLTPVIDQHSQAIAGLEMSEKPRSAWSAISALVNAILPSDPEALDFAQTESGCEFYGKPGVIVFDNALYNHSNDIEIMAASLGFIAGWAKPYTPTEKAYQEGWHGRLKRDFLPNLAGFRGDKKSREGLQEGMASATMGLLEFRQALYKWIYDVYCNTPLADGVTARQKWHLGLRWGKPRIPLDVWGHKLAPCLHKTLKLRPEGVLFCGLIYSAPFLTALRKKHGHNVDTLFRYNPGNLGEIYVQDPITKAFIPVLCTDQAYAEGLTLYQHKLIRKLCTAQKIRNPSIPQLLLYREKLRLLTEQLRFSNRLKDRKRAARTGDVPADADSPSNTKKSPPEVTITVTELEDKLINIEEVEMELDDDGWNLANAA